MFEKQATNFPGAEQEQGNTEQDNISGRCSDWVTFHPVRVEQGNYHVNVYHVYSGVQHPMISMLFIPRRI